MGMKNMNINTVNCTAFNDDYGIIVNRKAALNLKR